MKSFYIGSLVIDPPISFIARNEFSLKLYLNISVLSFKIYRVYVVSQVRCVTYFLAQFCWWSQIGVNLCWLQEYPNSGISDNTPCVQSAYLTSVYLQSTCKIWNFSSQRALLAWPLWDFGLSCPLCLCTCLTCFRYLHILSYSLSAFQTRM